MAKRSKDLYETKERQFLGETVREKVLKGDYKNYRYCSNCQWITTEKVIICENCGNDLYSMYSIVQKVREKQKFINYMKAYSHTTLSEKELGEIFDYMIKNKNVWNEELDK